MAISAELIAAALSGSEDAKAELRSLGSMPFPHSYENGVLMVNKRSMTAEERKAFKTWQRDRRTAWIASNPQSCTSDFDGICRCNR